MKPKITYEIGIGEYYIKRDTRIQPILLNNEEITRYKIKKFLNSLKIKNLTVILSNKNTIDYDKRIIWGYYFGPIYCKIRRQNYKRKVATIILYRHSVWTFLHELAHHLSFGISKTFHDKIFNDKLKYIYYEWKKEKWRKNGRQRA